MDITLESEDVLKEKMFYGYYFKNCNYGQTVCDESVICIQFQVIVIIKFAIYKDKLYWIDETFLFKSVPDVCSNG